MKALVLEEYGHFVYRDWPTPVPGPGEVLIRVKACAVCGSDVHGMDGSTGRRRPPLIMGHEAAGVIEALGEGVTDHTVGERVTFDSTVYCGQCPACKAGLINLCEHRQVLGVSCEEYRRHGAMAEYLTVPAYILYPLPDKVSFVQASLVEPMSVAYHGVMQAPVPTEGVAMVVGCGTIGILAIQVLKGLGVPAVIGVDVEDRRRELAKKAGASAVINSRTENAHERIAAATAGKGPDVSYDMTGIAATVLQCIEETKENGHVVFVGNLAKEVTIPLQKVILKQLGLHGSCASAGEYPECLKLIAEGKAKAEEIVSGCFPLAEGDRWIHKVYDREDGLDKIVLIPE